MPIKDENGWKIALPFPFSYFFDGNGSGINGNAKTDKYDRKIDGNKQYART
jgi:hypothetical protein